MIGRSMTGGSVIGRSRIGKSMIAAQRLRADERGSILPLILGYAVLALAVVIVVTAATSLHLERKRLFTLADGAALAGAESFDIVAATSGPRPLLTSAAVATTVLAHLDSANAARFDGLEVLRADSPDGMSARVTLAARWRPPLLSAFTPDGLRLEVTAHARTAFR